MSNSTLYKIIGFAENTNGFFNEPHFSRNFHEALLIYSELVENEEMDGAVLIECQHEEWKVIMEFGTYPYSVECSALFTHKVTKSPDLVMV